MACGASKRWSHWRSGRHFKLFPFDTNTVYMAFGFLEDSGLFARIAVVTDRLARKVGLSGKAVLPLILGLGCNVPSILGTRVLEEERERLLAMLIDPLIPCQAGLFVILVVASAVTHNYWFKRCLSFQFMRFLCFSSLSSAFCLGPLCLEATSRVTF